MREGELLIKALAAISINLSSGWFGLAIATFIHSVLKVPIEILFVSISESIIAGGIFLLANIYLERLLMRE